jgi:lysozyme
MTNKASVHISQPSGSITGLGDWLAATAKAGRPAPVIYSVNGNLDDTIHRYSPTTKFIYRRQSTIFNRLPPNFFNDDPVVSATNWLTKTIDKNDQNRTLIQNWLLNPADWYDPLNEPAPTTIAQAQYLNTWMITALDIAWSYGKRLALFSFPTGSPAMELWPYLYDAMRKGVTLGAILSVHEYSVTGTMQNPQPGNVLRYRTVYKSLPNDCKMQIIVSECGAGNGYNADLTGQPWINDLMWYNSEACQDSYLLGFCAYQLGGAESNMVQVLPQYATAIQGFTCPATPPPEPESPDGATVPPIDHLVDSFGHVWNFGPMLSAGYAIQKNGLQFSGGQGNLILYYGKQIYTRNNYNEWYIAGATSWSKIPGDPRAVLKNGVDVSLYQGTIAWSQAKSSISYAFIKATQGAMIIDPQFRANWTGAKLNGIPRGAYHYFKFSEDPKAQANYFLAALQGDLGELPPIIDVEDTAAPADINKVKAFIDAVELATNRRCMVYTSVGFWNNARWGGPVSWAKEKDLWVAAYTSAPLIPSDWTTWRFWQYSNSGTIAGIPAAVDLNQFNGTITDFQNYLANLPQPPTVVPTPKVIQFGLGYGTQNELPQVQADFYGSTFTVNGAFKFLTLPDSGMMTRSIQRIAAKKPAFMGARIFFSPGNTPFTPQNFVDYSANGTVAAYAQGILDFEVHNEPNLPSESSGTWSNGNGFGNWLKSTLVILKSRYPSSRFWFPGLSPNDAAPQFMIDALATGVGSMIYGYCFHSYWQSESGGAWNMVDESGGMSWKKIWRAMPSSEQAKPIWISEFSNNTGTVSNGIKGGQYRRYQAQLAQAGVNIATSFVLYWSGDPNHESWVNANGGSTGIKEGYLLG